MKCPLCSNSNIDFIDIRYPLFRHLDFATIKQSGRLGRCTACQIVLNDLTRDEINQIEGLFRSTDYARCKTMTHTLFVKSEAQPKTRTSLQAEFLRGLLKKANPIILDIGCFDGELLTEIDRRFKSAELHGFDVNEHLRSVFPTRSNFYFWSPALKEVEGSFDLICLSGSIVYVSDIPELLGEIKRLLRPDGSVFVQCVDISTSPYAILLGDQRTHYTGQILSNLFNYFGFQLSLLDNSWAPREIVAIGKRGIGFKQQKLVEDTHIYNCITHLDKMAAKIRAVRISPNWRLGVLGTSAAAAFVDSLLGSKVAFFVDENPKRVGQKFRSKDVIHPSVLNNSAMVIVPYGPLSQRIKERFSKAYRGQFICQ